MSHMESKEQRWPNGQNVRLGELGDISAAFNYGFSEALMNNLWVYDFNMLEESQNHQEMIESELAVSDPAVSSASPWSFTSTPSTDLYGSADNQGSAISKRSLGKTDLTEPTFKKQKSQNLENNDLISESVSVNGVGRWLEDVGFGRYAGMFEMHEVDEEALPLLTLDDLKEMGVLAVGARRKLYTAICRLKGK
ncbi:hypothetical protein L1987_51675 [Smallanthus sonchifolius]|uniref:Uncharacterized protein n=1 Tax=Smallanthus sonchifolius TaxID=185202 RepID=A0ACB9ERM2_9ASTR|nr:hypothetical protein L1987_51675 [Smallanthus sonchifolius]